MNVHNGADTHKAIGHFPKPKSGWTPGSYKYLRSYNLLAKQVKMKDLSVVSLGDFYATQAYKHTT